MTSDATLEQALTVAIAEATTRAHEAMAVTRTTTAMAAATLHERGYSDRSIATLLGVSRNRIRDLVASSAPQQQPEWAQDWIDQIWAQAQRLSSPWLHDTTLLHSGEIMAANDIAILPVPGLRSLQQLDTSGAQFIDTTTMDRLLIYSRQRWQGSPLRGKKPRAWDHQGWYIIEYVDRATGERTPLHAHSDLGLPEDAAYFGRSWPHHPARVCSDGDAFQTIVRALQAKYSILPSATDVQLAMTHSWNSR